MASRELCWRIVLVVSVVAGLASASGAAVVIDTLSDWDNIYNVNSFGEGTTPTYGQTITVPSDNVLDRFTFKLLQGGGGNSTTIRFFVMAWDGIKVAGPVLLQTGPVTLSNSGFYQDYTVTTGGLPLITGNKYAMFFTSVLDFDGFDDASSAAAHHHSTDPYLGGQFIHNDNALTFADLSDGGWHQDFLGPGDLSFRAEFSSVPEASSLAIVLLTGLSAAAFSKKIRSCLTGGSKTTSV